MTEFSIEEPPRSKRVATFIKFTIFLGLGFFIIWLSLRGLTPEERIEILHSFRIANYNWVILTIALGIISHLLRALRWMLFFEPLGYHPSLKNTFFAVMVGYFANMAFPRLGEVTRCGILTRYEKIPFNKSFGTVITERAIDMFTFVFLFFLMIVTQAGTIGHFLSTNVYPKFAEKFQNPLFSRVFVLSIIGFCIIIGGIIYLLRRRIAASSLFHKINNLILGFWDGLKSLSQITRPGLFIFYSISIWTLYFFMIYVCFFCFTDTSFLGPGAGLSALVLGSVGILVTPGGIGLYPAIIQETMILYGITRTTGLALGWISWTAQTGMILMTGGISLILLSFNKHKNGTT
ncbi:MAG: lysylphosphatidylglycerol synthase transmembrane domain-containing protein [Bacteroidales bacterium]|nr:lysylphosphatidylglycerol synthase transmembrane domain-containing protein [Bacteroidales bacterium]